LPTESNIQKGGGSDNGICDVCEPALVIFPHGIYKQIYFEKRTHTSPTGPSLGVKLDIKPTINIINGLAGSSNPRVFPVGLGDHVSFPKQSGKELGIHNLEFIKNDCVTNVNAFLAALSNWSTHVATSAVAIGRAPCPAFFLKALGVLTA
jgi:hypothetical protein